MSDRPVSPAPPRSWLFVPAHQPRRVGKALASAAEAVIVDLEDGVPADQRETALQTLANMPSPAAANRTCPWYVRVHAVSEATFEHDMREASRAGVNGVVLPKVATPDDVQRADALARQHGRPLALVPLIESPAGLLHASDIAGANKQVAALMLGAEDLSVQLGPYIGQHEGSAHEGLGVLHARWMVAVAAAAHGIPAIDKACLKVRDENALAHECAQACELGFSGKALIHPDQIEGVHAAFQPSAARVAWADRVVAAAARAQAQGQAAVVVDGAMIDAPVLARARQVIELVRR